jgi:MFS transporter
VAGTQPPGNDDPTVVDLPRAPAGSSPAGPSAGTSPVPLPPAAGPPRSKVPGRAGVRGGAGVGPGSTGTPPGPGSRSAARGAAGRARELAGGAVGRVRAAGRADGAGDSGLAGLLWTNALHAAGDAMIAVSLAGTLFFTAPADAQRGNVALYLVVTMAPFAVLAPVIGPALDRLRRGRRWALAASLAGRAVLAVLMAAHYDDLALYPAALGVLVLSKAFTVLRAAVVPRVLPAALSLTSANARMSVFGLATGSVLGGLGAGVAALLGFTWELGATAAVFTAAAVLAVRLPSHVDASTGEQPAGVFSTAEIPRPGARRRPAGPRVATALRTTAALRGLGGFLTVFSAFLVRATVADGWAATVALGGIAAAAAAGSFGGTVVGSRLQAASPDRVVLISAGGAAVVTAGAAALYSLPMAALVAGVCTAANALGKVSLDAIIQREVPDSLRASAFARSETALQLAWVGGGVLGIALPPTGWLGFTVASALLTLAVALTLAGRHRASRAATGRAPAGGEGRM